ncbi:MAG: hypothetical protein IT324_01510 [Anaerolineae bacterium]|nr:hypothetical protein [Anaerolineae bacterium]
MRPVRLVMTLAVLVTALFSAVTLSGQSNPVNAAQATGAATVAPTTAGGAVTATGAAGGSTAAATAAATASATTAATTAATTGGTAPAAATATLTQTATRQPAGRATVGPRPVVFGPCPNPNMAGAAGAITATVARPPAAAATATTPIDMGPGVTVAIDSRSTALAQGGQFEIVTQILDLQPGAVTVPHVHTGPATVVVITGEVTNCTATTQQVFSTGQSWTERPNAVGAIANTGSAVARIAMIMITPRNRPPMVVVPVITVTPGTR